MWKKKKKRSHIKINIILVDIIQRCESSVTKFLHTQGKPNNNHWHYCGTDQAI